MRKILLCLFFAVLPVSLLGQSVSRDNTLQADKVSFKYSFVTIKPENITLQKISEYLSQYMNYSQIPNQSGFTGAVSGLYGGRDKHKKYAHSFSIDLFYTIDWKKVTFYVIYYDITRNEIICDKSQKHIDTPLDETTISKGLRGYLDYIGDDLVDHIRDFVNKDEKNISRHFSAPIWWNLSYIIDEESISYFDVINSERNLPKEELYSISNDFFTSEYGSKKDEVRNRDSEKFIVSVKGLYEDLETTGIKNEKANYEAPHIFSIQCRDGRARASVSISSMNTNTRREGVVNVLKYKPFSDKELDGFENALEAVELKISNQFVRLKEAFDNGIIMVDVTEDW